MRPLSRFFKLPDLLSSCPLRGATNPHYSKAAAESRAWINGYNIFTDRKQAFFIQGSNELLCSYTYSYAGYEEFRTCCDFVNLLFVVDEVSDDQNGQDAAVTTQVFLNVMKDPNWDDGSTLATITREFRQRLTRLIRPNAFRRFLKHCENYTHCVAEEAILRERNEVLDVTSFIHLRRENSAIRLCYALVEYILGTDLPDDVFEDPFFSEMYFAAVDHVCWANDIYSYSMEEAKGIHGNNIVTVLRTEYDISLQEASNLVGVRCDQLMKQYLSAKKHLPSWAPAIDREVKKYLNSIGMWMVGNLLWSFETRRYFGHQHLEVKKTLLVALQPEKAPKNFIDSDSDSDGDY